MACRLSSTNPTMAVSGKSKDPAVAQSMMLDVSVVLCRCWNPKVGSSVRCARSQEQELPLPCSYVGSWQEVWPMCVFPLQDPVHRCDFLPQRSKPGVESPASNQVEHLSISGL